MLSTPPLNALHTIDSLCQLMGYNLAYKGSLHCSVGAKKCWCPRRRKLHNGVGLSYNIHVCMWWNIAFVHQNYVPCSCSRKYYIYVYTFGMCLKLPSRLAPTLRLALHSQFKLGIVIGSCLIRLYNGEDDAVKETAHLGARGVADNMTRNGCLNPWPIISF